MLTAQVIAELNSPSRTPMHEKLYRHVQEVTDMSRNYMSKMYTKWDAQNNAYRAYRSLDKDDIKAIQEGRPSKQAIPMVYAKVQTFKSFVLGMYFQRPRFYELTSVGVEDEDYKELAEVLLEGDLEYNGWYNKVAQWSTHLGKHGLGIIKHSWKEDFDYVPSVTLQPAFAFGPFSFGKSEVETVTKVPTFAGNEISVVSPYSFLPDVRFNLVDFQKGEFCGDEFDISRVELFKMQQNGEVAGINSLPVLSYERAGFRKRIGLDRRSHINYNAPDRTPNLVRITATQIKVTPSQFELADGTKLGKENYPVHYLVWIANDHKIIKLEPMGHLHRKFTYNLAQYDEDDTDFCNMSLTDLVQPLQDTADWFLNSRIESVSRAIEDKLIVDPIGVEVETVRNRSRLILLKKGASRAGVDKYIKQLDVHDVTTNHPQDIALIGQMVNSITGVSDNMQGNYHSGRRSAAEARVVAQGSSARIKMIAQIAWGSCMVPLGKCLLTNLRQGLSPEMIIKYAGQDWLAPEKQPAIIQFNSEPAQLISSRDFFVFDGTLSTEKNYTAQQLSELFQQVIALGPQGIVSLELSPKLLLEKIYELLGVPSLKAFDIRKDPQTLQNAVMSMIQTIMQEQMQNLPAPTDENA